MMAWKQICAVEEIRRVKIGVDSGAAVSVWPRDLCKDYPTGAHHTLNRLKKNTGTKNETAGKDSKHLVNCFSN